jgi:hypothetical protein
MIMIDMLLMPIVLGSVAIALTVDLAALAAWLRRRLAKLTTE